MMHNDNSAHKDCIQLYTELIVKSLGVDAERVRAELLHADFCSLDSISQVEFIMQLEDRFHKREERSP